MSITKRLDDLRDRIRAVPTCDERSIDLDRLSVDELRELRILIVKAGGDEVRDWNLLEIKELERAEFLIDKSTVLNNGKNNYAKNA